MNASFTARRPETDDLTEIQALLLSGMNIKTPLATLAEELSRDDRDLQVLTDEDGGVVAWSAARILAGEAELFEIVVSVQCRRWGLGGQMLDSLISRLRIRGTECLHLEVRAGNLGAIALYESRGFIQVGLRRGYYSDGEDARLYSLDLSTGGVGVSRG